MKIKVLVVGSLPPPIGGIAQFILNMKSYFSSAGLQMDYFNLSKPNIKRTKEYLGFWKGGFKNTVLNLFSSLWLTLTFFYHVLTNRYDIIHFHTAHSAGFWWNGMLSLLAKATGAKTILHIHGSRSEDFWNRSGTLARKTMSYMMRKSNAVIALSSSLKSFFETSIGLTNVHIVMNGVPDLYFETNRTESARLTGVFVGALVERKGVYDLFESIQHYKQAFGEIPWQIRVIGPGDIPLFQDRVNAMELQDHISVEGPMTVDELSAVYSSSDFFVLPSYFEGVPLVILEAMASGLPVISTNVGGIPDVVKEGVNGYLIQPGDPISLAGLMHQVYLKSDEFKRIGANNREEAGELYRFSSTMNNIKEIYSLITVN